MNSSLLIDWLSISYAWEALPRIYWKQDYPTLQALCSYLLVSTDGLRQIKARYGFTYALQNHRGQILYLSEPGNTQGIHVVNPGSSLEPGAAQRQLTTMFTIGGKCTRIDISVDVKGGIRSPHFWRDEYVKGAYEGYKRSWRIMEGSQGETLYIGSRSSDKYMRIYDKRAEQGLDPSGESWVRIEMECKDDMARAVAHMIQTEGVVCIPSVIRGMVDFHDKEWQMAMLNATGVSLKGEKRLTDTRKWLLDTVAKTVAREYLADSEFMATFVQRVLAEVDEMKG